MPQSELLTIDEFCRFASKIAKRDKWFIGGFLGEVYEEWQEKHPKPEAHQCKTLEEIRHCPTCSIP